MTDTNDTPTATKWTEVRHLLSAFESLAAGNEPKAAAAALGKAHKRAVQWSLLAETETPTEPTPED